MYEKKLKYFSFFFSETYESIDKAIKGYLYQLGYQINRFGNLFGVNRM